MNSIETANASATVMPIVCLSLLISFFPQNCDIKMEPPDTTPNITVFITKKIWFPSPTAAISTAPSCPTITVSIIFTNEVRKFCMIIGRAILKTVL